jgi:RHS repeat-associated protein
MPLQKTYGNSTDDIGINRKGKLLYTGITENSSSHEDLIDDLKDEVVVESWSTGSGIGNTGYTCDKYTPENLLTVNYYDNYNFIALTDAALTYDNSSEDEYGYKHPSAKGLLTGTRTYLLDGSGTYTATAHYYDFKGQVIQSRSSNHLGGYDYIYNQYNFTGNVTKTLKQHDSLDDNSDPHKISELYVYSYDHALRLVTTTYILNSNPPILLASNKYDELGRLVEKKRHNETDTEQFEYNIRGWAAKIKSGDFEENILYNTGLPQGATACYNGNIAYSTWKYNSFTSGYVYQYDDLNRLTDSYFKDVNSNNYYGNGCYDESFVFDKQGNIKSVNRTIYGTDVDYLTLNYRGNQLIKVTDVEGSWASYNIKEYHDKANLPLEFLYDSNGNMTKDLDRNIDTIKYNLLNLPDTIQFSNGNQIVHTYDAGGRKFRTEYFTLYTPIQIPLSGIYNWNNRWDVLDTWEVKAYAGNFEYHQFKDSHDDYYILARINNTEGYVTSLTSPSYNYYRKDHVGNNREVWKAVANATIQRTQYYPSGLPIEFNNGDNPGWQPYKYGGKEFVEMHGLDEYDFGHRGFYVATGRFTTIDWKAEETYEVSPYSYACNNPVRFRDENGDGLNDLVKGFVNAVTDNTTMGITDQSGTASYDDADDYNTGQAIGNVASVILGGLETIAGGGTAAGGSALAVVGSGTGVAIPVGVAAVTEGATMMAHGTMMMAKGVSNLKNQNGRTNTTVTSSTRKEAKDARPKPDPAKPGGKQVTNQTRNKSGEGNKMKTDGNSQTPHFHDKNHNKPNKPNVHYRTTKRIKPNE